MEDCGVTDSSDELDCRTLYWGDEKGAYAKEKPPKPTDIGEGSKVKGSPLYNYVWIIILILI